MLQVAAPVGSMDQAAAIADLAKASGAFVFNGVRKNLTAPIAKIQVE